MRNIPDLNGSNNANGSRRTTQRSPLNQQSGRGGNALRNLFANPDRTSGRSGFSGLNFNRTNRPNSAELQKFAEQIRLGRVGKNGQWSATPSIRSFDRNAVGRIAGGRNVPDSLRDGLRGDRDGVRGNRDGLLSARERFKDRLAGGNLRALIGSNVGRKFQLDRQWDLLRSGDVSRRLNLAAAIHDRGGWRKWRHYGPFSSSFVSLHFGGWYPGPSYYPRWCWYPHWSSWVDWSWWDYCDYGYDPRPIYSRPVIYDPCAAWAPWSYPDWRPLPVVACGTWIDVDPLAIDAGLDLQLLAVRFVDPGHPEKKLGPRYRVWFRNNSPLRIEQPFNVVLLAANGVNIAAGIGPDSQSPAPVEAGVRVEGIDAGAIQSVDIRLPFEANQIGRDSQDRPVPFSHLHVLLDSHREIPEAFEENNGAVLAVGDILSVDPAAFAAESDTLAAGSLASIAGEGFGPEPGQVVLFVGGLELQAEIHGWYDLGVRFQLPNLPLAAATDAELVVIRGDGAVSNPLSIKLTPPGAADVPPPAD